MNERGTAYFKEIDPMFRVYGLDTAPSDSVPRLKAAQEAVGFLPNLFAVLAESPLALETYSTVGAIFRRGTLSRIEQNVVLLTRQRGHPRDGLGRN